MILLVKLLTILIVSLLLFPIAKIFWGMTRYQIEPVYQSAEQLAELEKTLQLEAGSLSDNEPIETRVIDSGTETEEEWFDPTSGNSGFIISSEETEIFTYSVGHITEYQSPFNWSARFLQFGPRKWVGFIGLGSTVLIYLLLVFSALVGAFVPVLPETARPQETTIDEPPPSAPAKAYQPPTFDSALAATDSLQDLPLKRIQLGVLNCPSGKLIASDPLAAPNIQPFARTIKPGKYLVELFQVITPNGGKRIALAILILSNATTTSWPLALKGEQSLEDLEAEGDYYGFPVDAGMGCFVDQDSLKAYNQFLDQKYESDSSWNSWDDYFAERFLENADPNVANDIGDWYHFEIPDSPNHNMAMFASGWGDGTYPAYWGLDKNGAATHLIIDFHVLDFSKN